MRPRTIKLSVSVMGMSRMPIATITVTKFADVRTPTTDLICPSCGEKPKYHSGYDCPCGVAYNHWSALQRVVRATKKIIEKVRLLQEKEEVMADVFRMPMELFSVHVDATFPNTPEYGVTVKDEASAKNLKKLIIASEKLNTVVLVRYNDTFEEVVCVLTLSISGRVILKNLIPMNLLEIKETMRVNLTDLSSQELQEAEAFVKMLPEAKDDLLNVSDYRTIGLDEQMVSPKVIELEEIMARAKEIEAAPLAA